MQQKELKTTFDRSHKLLSYKSVSALSHLRLITAQSSSHNFVIKQLPYKKNNPTSNATDFTVRSLAAKIFPKKKKNNNKKGAEANKQATIILQHYSLPVNAFF